jgi:hypothetical protein
VLAKLATYLTNGQYTASVVLPNSLAFLCMYYRNYRFVNYKGLMLKKDTRTRVVCVCVCVCVSKGSLSESKGEFSNGDGTGHVTASPLSFSYRLHDAFNVGSETYIEAIVQMVFVAAAEHE